MDDQDLESITQFKEALQRSDDASDSDQEFVGQVHTNRGKKLKRGAKQVQHGRMGVAPLEEHGVKVVMYGDKKKAVVYKKRKVDHKEDGEQDDSGDEINPYDDIKLDDLLKPIGHPSEVPMHDAINRTFTGSTIKSMATRAMEIINEEQKHTIQYSRLLAAFLGDNPEYAKEMVLPAYDHLKDSINDDPDSIEGENGAANSNGERRVTRKQVSQEMDPFFDAPQLPVDRDFGFSKEVADETRQMAQIAQQRSDEFVRSMTSVRMGLLRADRLRDQVYKWCKEMNGEGEGMSEGGDNAEETDSDEEDEDDEVNGDE